jgi:hypothetical protein
MLLISLRSSSFGLPISMSSRKFWMRTLFLLQSYPSNHAMERTSGSFGFILTMKFRPQPAATRFLASRRSSYSR